MTKIVCRPVDSRCLYVAQLIRPDTALPEMRQGKVHVPGEDVRRREVDLQEGEWLIQGEARHHRHFRGWDYNAHTVQDGILYCFRPTERLKAALKVWVGRGPDRRADTRKLNRGIPSRGRLLKEHMKGAGDQAALLRLVVADRREVSPADIVRTLHAMTRADRMERSRIQRAADARDAKARAAQAVVEAAREQAREDERFAARAIEAGMGSFVL